MQILPSASTLNLASIVQPVTELFLATAAELRHFAVQLLVMAASTSLVKRLGAVASMAIARTATTSGRRAAGKLGTVVLGEAVCLSGGGSSRILESDPARPGLAAS